MPATSASSPTASPPANNGPSAIVDTSLGSFTIQLYPSYAPKTVANFISLAKSGFYDHVVWHRIVPGFVIQTGDPNTKNGGGDRDSWGQGTSGTSVPFEGPPGNPLTNIAGSVAMASTGARVGGECQFYINLVNNPSLNGNYAVFGQVTSGMDVVNALAAVSFHTSPSSPYYGQPTDPSQALVLSVRIVGA